MYFFKVVLSNSSPGFLKVKGFLWTFTTFSLIFTAVLIPDHFQRNILLLIIQAPNSRNEC